MAETPISLKSPLAGNPTGNPQFEVKAKLKNGEEIPMGDPNATRAMVALMDMQAVMGGAASHWGGPSAFAELMSSTFSYMFHASKKEGKEWFEKFHFVNDAGHCENGIYALKANWQQAGLNVDSLKGFRSIESKLTGHGESHLFPEGVYVSNGPLGSGLPQAQGLSMADAIAGKKRVTITAISDGACMEGEAKESLSAIPGLAKNGKMGAFVLVISDNNTKLSGRIDEESFSMQPSFDALSAMGWNVMSLNNGNDLEASLQCLEQAVTWAEEHPEQPVVIHAKTVKGFGVKKTEESASGGHGFPLKSPEELSDFMSEIYGDENVPQVFNDWANELVELKNNSSSGGSSSDVPKEKVQVGIAKALIAAKQKGLPVVSVTSDLPGSTGVAGFRKEFPQCSLDVGVAESNMVSVATGLSKEGFIPVVDTFSQFGVTKGALPFIMSSLSQGPMIAIFSHAGFQDAADGASHQALSYFAMTASIPGVDTYCLTCSSEAEQLLTQAVDKFAEDRKSGKLPRTSIFFLGRENFPRYVRQENEKYSLGSSFVAVDNSAEYENCTTVVAAGPLLFQALKAAEELKSENHGLIVVNPSAINRVDTGIMKNALKLSKGRLVTVEDHQEVGGMSAMLVHALARNGISFQLIDSLGVKGEFGQSAYKADQLYAKHGLDSQAIVKSCLK